MRENVSWESCLFLHGEIELSRLSTQGFHAFTTSPSNEALPNKLFSMPRVWHAM